MALACLLAACSSGGAPDVGYAQRFADGGSCPVSTAAELPDGTGCVTSATADLDGDGNPDRFGVAAKLAEGRPVSWWARAIIGDTATPPIRLPVGGAVGGRPVVYPRVAGAAEADGEPGAEVFVQLSADIYHGAATPIVAIYEVRDGRVASVTSGGRLFTFSTSGI